MASLNAILNAISAVLLVLGFSAIRRREIQTHRRYMLMAFGASVLFLISYLVYHFRVGSVAENEVVRANQAVRGRRRGRDAG